MVVSQTRGTPNNHLFFDGIFHEKNHPFLGVPPWTPQVLPVFLRCFLRFTPEISVSPSHGCFNIRRTADSAMAPWRSLGPWDLGIVRMANCETKQKKLGCFLETSSSSIPKILGYWIVIMLIPYPYYETHPNNTMV